MSYLALDVSRHNIHLNQACDLSINGLAGEVHYELREAALRETHFFPSPFARPNNQFTDKKMNNHSVFGLRQNLFTSVNL